MPSNKIGTYIELYKTVGRIEGKVDTLTEMATSNTKRIDSKVGWGPFGVFIAGFIAVSSFLISQVRNN